MIPILQTPDEFSMNLEVANISFRRFLFSQLFAGWEQLSQRTWLARQSRPNKVHRAGPMSLAYRGAIIRA